MNSIFVFDTNALISSYLLNTSVNRKAYDKAKDKGLLVRSEQTMEEFRFTFSKPKFDRYLSVDKRVASMMEYEMNSFLIPISFNEKVCRDPKDDMFINLALSANASFIITGDSHLLELNGFKKIAILSASDFLRLAL
jgi:uncharacterized protein